MKHHCHAIGCKNTCPPRWLMCRSCWGKVPPELQNEVYRTVGLRAGSVNHTWAPWWRAQARAIHAVVTQNNPGRREAQYAYLAREMSFAEKLEERR